jgi:hexosaminidase
MGMKWDWVAIVRALGHCLTVVYIMGLLLPASAQTTSTQNKSLFLMPIPAQVSIGTGNFPIDRHLRIQWSGYISPLLDRAATRFLSNLNRRTGIIFQMDGSQSGQGIIRIQCAAADPNFLTVNANEAYELKVTPQEVILKAPGPTGILRGLATLLQLAEANSSGFSFNSLAISDHPRFAWRGIMIDISRHFIPPDVVERQLDAMEAVKLNVLHLHISDSEAFSIESKLFPRLQKMGTTNGQYYTQEQTRELIAYARDRGIRVVPEFDVPGHVKSWLAGYPEMGSGPGPYRPESDYAGEDAAFDPTNEHVYKFLNQFFGEMMGLFSDHYFHIGGDEVPGKQWSRNPYIQEFMHNHSFQNKGQLQAYFTGRVNRIIRSRGRAMIGWDEVLDADIPKDTVIEAWRGPAMTLKSVQAGHATIVASPYYLDQQLPAATYYVSDPFDTGSLHLGVNEEKLIIGGEAAMWTEIITPEMLDAGLWPRSSAIAERFWSPRSVKDVNDMYRRLFVVDREMEILGTRQYANRRRMIDRLSPQDPDPLEVFTDVVEPIKGLARWHSPTGGFQPDQNALADAAFPESLRARKFSQEVHALLAGDNMDSSLLRQLRNDLSQWQSNDPEFEEAAKDTPLMQSALPVSRDLMDLASVGLESLNAIEDRQRPSSEWINTTEALLRKQAVLADSSKNQTPQPPSELLIAVVPGITELVQAAERISH